MKSRSIPAKVAGLLFVCASLAAAPLVRAADIPDSAWNAPSTYYSNLTDASGNMLTGSALKSRLQTIISTGFTAVSYDNFKVTMPITDRVYGTTAAQQQMWGIYDRTVLPGYWDNQATWNREHIWPQSKLNGVTDHDQFGVRPAYVKSNSTRANYGYGGYSITDTTTPAGLLPKASGATSPLFYAGPYDRGDTARACFYMATRYASQLTIVATNDGTTSGAGTLGDLNSMLRANYLDPVDNFERRRNQMIYKNTEQTGSGYSQNNRNPYVDHPEWVWAVFGDGANDSQITVNTATNGASSRAVNFGRVIVGGTAPTLSTTVAVNKSGADPTTFNVTTSGGATTDMLGNLNTFDYGSVTKTMTVGLTGVTTTTAGAKTGVVTIDNTDITTQGVGTGSGDGDDTINLSLNVLDHSDASFDAATDAKTLIVNFGLVDRGRTAGAKFSIANLLSASGYTAGLDLDSVVGTGDTGVFGTGLSTFAAMTAGTARDFLATFTPTRSGAFNATYTLNVSDEDLSGATSSTLTLVFSGVANAFTVPEPAMLAVALPAFALLRRRRAA